MSRGLFYAAFVLAAVMCIEWADPAVPPPPAPPAGCVELGDGEIDCPPTSCDECRTDAECEALCPEVEV